MLSVLYESQLTVDPLAAVPFTVNTEDTKLKFAKSISGTLLYTVDGKVPTDSHDKTSFIVGLSLANLETVDKKLTAISRMKRRPYTDLIINENSVNEVEIDGISGYEIIGEGVDKSDAKELVYQVMLFTDNGYYIILGAAKDNFEQNLELFKKVARTLRRK